MLTDPPPETGPLNLPSRRPAGCIGRSGCGAGCLGITLFMILALSAFGTWFVGEAPIVPSETLVGPNTTAFSIVHLDDEDPGVHSLVDQTLVGIWERETRGPNLPKAFQEAAGQLLSNQLPKLLPVEVLVTHDIEPDAPPDRLPTPTFVIGFGRMRGLTWAVSKNLETYARNSGERLEEYRGAQLLSLDLSRQSDAADSAGNPRAASVRGAGSADIRSAWLGCVSGNTFVLSPEAPAVRQMVDRLLEPSGTFRGRGSLAEMYRRLDARQDLLGVMSDERGQIRRLLEAISRDEAVRGVVAGPRLSSEFVEAASQGIRALGWEVDVLSADRMDVRLLLACRSQEFARRVRSLLLDVANECLRMGLAEGTPRFVDTDHRLVDFRLRFTNLRRLLRAEPEPRKAVVPGSSPSGAASPSPSPLAP